MKIEFTDTFFESLKRLQRHETWWYKTYSAIRWDIPHFFKNIWRFRKELYRHEWWDYRFTLDMMQRSLEIMEQGMSTKGLEVTETREPKVKQMRRAIELLKSNREDAYIDRAEQELGELKNNEWLFEGKEDTPEEREHNRKVFERARQIQNDEWNELWTIFKGTKYSKTYGPKYDGTDMRGWWD